MKKAGWTQEKKQYFYEVKSCLRCSSSIRRRILKELVQVIECEPELSRQDLEERFGTPQQFSVNISEGMESEQIYPKNLRWRVAAALFVLIMAFAMAVEVVFWKSRPKEEEGYSILIIHPEDGSSKTVSLPIMN